jgi:hypothetical protein
LVEAAARVNGAPHTRRAYLSGLILDRSDAELRALIEGPDPVHGKPFMTQVIERLTEPAEVAKVTADRSTPRLLDAGTEENLLAEFERNGWTDFLPINLPTEARVAEMLAGTSHAPDEVIGKLRPAAFREFWEFTVEKVAVNAVMAGARPEYLPVILAAAAAVALRPGDQASNNIARADGVLGVSVARTSSITSFAAMTIVNGPIRNEIGMNYRIGALGPYNRANASIGRAFGMLAQNLQGGSVPGETYMGTLGSPLAYNSTCFAENEERSPWAPLHVRHGYDPCESVVSVRAGTTLARVIDIGELWQETLGGLIRAQAIAEGATGATLILDPDAARVIAQKGGPKTAREMLEWAADQASHIRAELLRDSFYWGMFRKPLADAGTEPFASWGQAPDDEMLEVGDPEQFEAVVTGGETAPTVYVSGGPTRRTLSQSIDAWR